MIKFVLMVARREWRLVRRSRAARGAGLLLAAVAWLPPVLLPLRAGTLGLASFPESLPLAIAVSGVMLPLLALLAGAELLSGELEDGTLVPIVTLPISRTACFLGKCLGRGLAMGSAYMGAFASVGVAIAATSGTTGWADYASVAVCGLLLALVSGAIGATLGASGRGRVRAFGAALLAWVGMVFALDAVLLALVVAMAPPPPGNVGMHGHDELRAPSAARPATRPMTGDDPHAHHAEPEVAPPRVLSHWLMVLNPVDLFRLSAIALGPGLQVRLGLALPGATASGVMTAAATGWLGWLVLPTIVGIRRFRRASLR